MNYEELSKDNDFHKWQNYEPLDTQYIRFSKTNPSAIAAGHKICDVYYAFCNAKHSFRSAGYHNFGDLSGNDEMSQLYTKAHLRCLNVLWKLSLPPYAQGGANGGS